VAGIREIAAQQAQRLPDAANVDETEIHGEEDRADYQPERDEWNRGPKDWHFKEYDS
jgi:hypothetical protein